MSTQTSMYFAIPLGLSPRVVAYRKACNEVLTYWEVLLLNGGTPAEYMKAYRCISALGLTAQAQTITDRMLFPHYEITAENPLRAQCTHR